ncbi:MAG: rRNA maturation RNase YbeY [Acidobacteriota bacterium]
MGDARGRPVRAPGLSVWLRAIAPARVHGRVGIALVSDRRVQLLNRTYRRLDHATDVLSFPAADEGRAGVAGRGGPDRWLGEIVIARGVARRQARSAGHSELTELRVLALHGLLHLLGYDHETDAGEMRRVEARLRRKGGLLGGLIERTR